MRVLITGGSGFIGRYVVRAFVEAGDSVTVFDLAAPPIDVEFIRGSIGNLEEAEAAMGGIDAVVHLAAIGDVYLANARPDLAIDANILGTYNVVQGAQRTRVRHLVYASTWEVYGSPETEPITEQHPCRPTHPYNLTKYAGERITERHCGQGCDWTILRLGTAFGFGMRDTAVIPAMVSRAIRGEPLLVHGTGKQFRQFTDAEDIARAFTLAVHQHALGIFNVVSEQRTTIVELAQLIASLTSVQIEHLPSREQEIDAAFIDSSKIRSTLGWIAETNVSGFVARAIASEAARTKKKPAGRMPENPT